MTNYTTAQPYHTTQSYNTAIYEAELRIANEQFETITAGLDTLENILVLRGIADKGCQTPQEFASLKLGVETMTERVYGEAKPMYAMESISEMFKNAYEAVANAIIKFFEWLKEKFKSFAAWFNSLFSTVDKIADIQVDPKVEAELKEKAADIDAAMDDLKDPAKVAKLAKAVEEAEKKINKSQSKDDKDNGSNVIKGRRGKVVKDFKDLGDLLDPATESLEAYRTFIGTEAYTEALESLLMSADAIKRVQSGSPDVTIQEIRTVKAMLQVAKINRITARQAALFLDSPDKLGKCTVNYKAVEPYFADFAVAPDLNSLRKYMSVTKKAIEWIESDNDIAAMAQGERYVKDTLVQGLGGKILHKGHEDANFYDVKYNGLHLRVKLTHDITTKALIGVDAITTVFGHLDGSDKNREYYIDMKTSSTLSEAKAFANSVRSSGYVTRMNQQLRELAGMYKAMQEILKSVKKEAEELDKGGDVPARATQRGISYVRSNLFLINGAYRILTLQSQMANDIINTLGVHGRMISILAAAAK